MKHKKIGIILPNLKFLTARRKYDAYVDSLKKFDIEVIDKFAPTGLPLGFSGGQKGAKKIIELKDLPTAMLFNDDLTTVGAIYEFARNGIYVPEDISIVSYDNTTMVSEMSPALCSIDNKEQESVNAAFNMLEERIAGLKEEPRQVTLDSQLIWRESCTSIARSI
jgi:DNA-binding LacI/PurR family transcriptional regulator